MDGKVTAALREVLDRLGPEEEAEAIVYPARSLESLAARLAAGQETGRLRFTVLALAGCAAVRAGRAVLEALAECDDVRLMTANPTFGHDTAEESHVR
ncbi:hypothetical protein AB0I81_37520 [Nonomuraea sp. NPDC050404]|uniref:hypothetical protein n=1 Tax=Nonomuraea sp. NPDC050404 TaxID=3155783 RepID=UPI00340B7B62